MNLLANGYLMLCLREVWQLATWWFSRYDGWNGRRVRVLGWWNPGEKKYWKIGFFFCLTSLEYQIHSAERLIVKIRIKPRIRHIKSNVLGRKLFVRVRGLFEFKFQIFCIRSTYLFRRRCVGRDCIHSYTSWKATFYWILKFALWFNL